MLDARFALVCRDLYFIECLSFLHGLDGPSKVNAIFTGLFFTLGIFPAVYAALLIPSARSGNKVRSYATAMLATSLHSLRTVAGYIAGCWDGNII